MKPIRGGQQAIVNRKRSFEETVSLSVRHGLNYTAKERWTLLLACGCKKVFRGMSAPAKRTTCSNGHHTGFVAESKAVAP